MRELERLCDAPCRVRIMSSAWRDVYTHPVFLHSLEEIAGVVLAQYVAHEQKAAVMFVEIEHTPIELPMRLSVRFSDNMLEKTGVGLDTAIKGVANMMCDIYDGKYNGMPAPHVAPKVEWEDLL